LLILDEPAASLDPAARRDFLKSLLEIAIEGERTVVLSTHITSDLERVADSVAVIKDGKIEFCGELGSLKDRVKRLHVTAREALPESFAVAGMLGRRIDGNEAIVGVKDFDLADVTRIRSEYGAEVEVRDLDLEDIFLELHQR
jgi:ABC-2 type transport system ATP-binding protein